MVQNSGKSVKMRADGELFNNLTLYGYLDEPKWEGSIVKVMSVMSVVKPVESFGKKAFAQGKSMGCARGEFLVRGEPISIGRRQEANFGKYQGYSILKYRTIFSKINQIPMLRLSARFVDFRSRRPTTMLLSPSFNQGMRRSSLRLSLGILERNASRESKKSRHRQSPYLVHHNHSRGTRRKPRDWHQNLFPMAMCKNQNWRTLSSALDPSEFVWGDQFGASNDLLSHTKITCLQGPQSATSSPRDVHGGRRSVVPGYYSVEGMCWKCGDPSGVVRKVATSSSRDYRTPMRGFSRK
ncbi:hypothetical protein GGX14DRAFT_403485 [Mycena pura]|uniref:Uncharacterized protein n=1 Tax=Mycena pura TaxID=153505 RepID=A0AAD6UVX1_9AGAR|nr:hypothetical protein GGX14DRAFT_403485 [Mycena pura]